MDSSVEKQGSGSLDPDGRTASGEPKACTDCYTTKTPLWRGGPFGPKSLCNACGIRYRKKRREALGLDGPKRREPTTTAAAAASAACPDDDDDAGGEEEEEGRKKPRKTTKGKRAGREEVTVELRMVGFGKEVVLKQRRRMRRRRRLGEEEKAAILLMALSSGVIYAS